MGTQWWTTSFIRTDRALAGVLLAAFVFLGAAPAAPPAPPPGFEGPRTAPPAAGPAPATQTTGQADPDYRIGVGDVLRIVVYGHEDLSQTVSVQAGGAFPYPLVGMVPAAGSTAMDVQNTIAKRLAAGLIREPQVTVSVIEFRSQQVFVVGQVARPGTYPLGGSTTLVEILSRSGPLTPGAGSEILIVRPAAEVERPVLPMEAEATRGGDVKSAGAVQAEVLRVNLEDIQAGRFEKNVRLKPNDTVFVPEAPRVFVTGEVRNPGAVAFSTGLTARQAVSLAGGFTEDASKGSVRIVRKVGGLMTEFKFGLDNAIHPGDTIVVKRSLF